jgi:pre-rRNA-processing protein IPI1
MVKAKLKRKKADKAKNQLKVSTKASKKARTKGGDIRLPKGLNVTDATFKTKKLVLLNQTQSTASKEALKAGLVTKKKLGLTELFAKLNNQSLSTRLDGLEGLKELLTAHKELIQDNLSLIINRLAPILSEKENKLRHAGVPLLESILSKVNSSALEPQYPVLCAHLCCGLSHIDDDIQLESIKVLDSIIESQPLFIVHHVNQILPNCIDQISTNSSDSTSVSQNKMMDTSFKHTATGKYVGSGGNSGSRIQNHMKENISSLQWRYMVVERIHKMLKILHHKVKGQTISQFNTIQTAVKEPRLATKEDIRLSHMGLYMDRYGVSNSSRSSSEEIFRNSSDHALKQNNFSAENFSQQLLPILIDTWNEVISETQSGKHKKTVSCGISLVQEHSVPIMLSVVNTTQAILQLVKEECQLSGLDIRAFKQNFGSELTLRIVSKFPYEVSHIKGRQKFTRKQGNNSINAAKEFTESTLNSSTIETPSGSFELNLSIIAFYVELLTLDENMQEHKDIREGKDFDNLPTKKQGKLNLTTSIEPILLYLTGIKDRTNEIERKKVNETVMTEALKKLSNICLLELKHTKLFNNLILILYNSNPTSRNVVGLMCYLTSTQTYNNDFEYIIQPFITDLPSVLLSEKLSYQHLKIIQLLFKKNDRTLIKALIEILPTFPQQFGEAINLTGRNTNNHDKIVIGELFKTVAIIFHNSSIARSVQDQGEKWRNDLFDSSESFAEDIKVLESYSFYKNALSELNIKR